MMGTEPERGGEIGAWFAYMGNIEKLEKRARTFAASIGLLAEEVPRVTGRHKHEDLEAVSRICVALFSEMQELCGRVNICTPPQSETATEGSPSTVADVGAGTTMTTNKDH